MGRTRKMGVIPKVKTEYQDEDNHIDLLDKTTTDEVYYDENMNEGLLETPGKEDEVNGRRVEIVKRVKKDIKQKGIKNKVKTKKQKEEETENRIQFLTNKIGNLVERVLYMEEKMEIQEIKEIKRDHQKLNDNKNMREKEIKFDQWIMNLNEKDEKVFEGEYLGYPEWESDNDWRYNMKREN